MVSCPTKDPTIARSLLLFAAAGLCEIGGGYLVWLWLREGRAVWLGALGGLVLFLYGVLPTLQPAEAPFGRVYAAYGGVFVALSLAWGWWVDGVRPDRWDLLGAAIALAGVAIIMAAPRGEPWSCFGKDPGSPSAYLGERDRVDAPAAYPHDITI